MSFNDLIDAVSRIFKLITDNTASVILSVIGLLLLLVAVLTILKGLKSDPRKIPDWLKAVLFITLISGIALSVAGPSLALLHFVENAIPQTPKEKAFDNLATNEFAGWLIRLIPFNPATQSDLAVSQLKKIGPNLHSFSFVAPYEEIRGSSAKDAVRKVGGLLPDRYHLSAIIFQLPSEENTVLYPANARGLLQVVREVESDPKLQIEKPLLKGTPELDQIDNAELNSKVIASWRYENYKNKYQKYCTIAHKFRCESFSAKSYIGEISDDWHPLGFSRIQRDDPCQQPVSNICTGLEWTAWKQSVLSRFGSRAFLLRNFELGLLPRRYLIDFGDPQNQVIPDIGVR